MSDNPVIAYGRWSAEASDAWPEAAVESARRQFVDTIGVTIPGALEPSSRTVLETVRSWGAGPSTVIGAGLSLAPPWAALVNGTAAHALDFDDNFDPAKAHASAVLVPAILAVAEQEEAAGRDCLDAYVAGLQILGRVGQGVNPAHRNRGWHATGTIGAIGAAAACARLLRLDAGRAGHALSIATSMAGGFMSQFGTMTKPLHAGLAAQAGVIAASLARSGLTGGLNVLDGPTGMNRLMVGPDYETLRDTLGFVEHGQTLRFETERVGEPLLILSSGFRVKRFPNCGSAHRAMDGLLALMHEHEIEASQVAEIHVSAPATHLANLMYEAPDTGLEAKFSLEYALAVLLVTGRCTLRDFGDGAVRRPQVRAWFKRIHRHPVDKPEGEFPTKIEVVLADGRRLVTDVWMPAGSLAAPFSDEAYEAKLDDNRQGLMDDASAEKLRSALRGLADLPTIQPLMRWLAGPWLPETQTRR